MSLLAARLAATVLVLACGCGGGDEPDRAARPRSTAFALLLDGRLLRVSLPDGTVTRDAELGPAGFETFGRALGLSPDGGRLFVLLPRQGVAPDRLAVVATATGEVGASRELTAGLEFRGLAVGRRTGRVYLFANRVGQRLGGVDFEAFEQAAVVEVRDAAGERVLDRAEVRPAAGHDWLVYGGAVAADETRVWVGYHGADTSGADAFVLPGLTPAPCVEPRREELGCLAAAHGTVAPRGASVIATTGEPRVVLLAADGHEQRRWETGLAGNHVTELAVAPDARYAYVVGSCGYAGGLSVLELGSDESRLLVPPEPPVRVCGQRLAVARGPLLVLARSGRPSPTPGAPGALLLVDAESGSVVRTVETSREPVDVVVVPGDPDRSG